MPKKMSKKSQVVNKNDTCQKAKHLDYGEGSQKKQNKQKQTKKETMRFTGIDINFDFTYEGHQNWSKILSVHI